MKKIVAVLLVITLMSALFIVPAHAHEADEVTPRSMLCDDPNGCNQPLAHRTTSGNKYKSVSGCTNNALTHNHYQKGVYDYYVCVNSSCSYYNKHVDEVFYPSSSTWYCIYR